MVVARPRKSAAARGLGYQHRKTRDALLRVHVDGSPCWWCDRAMYRDRERNWDYDEARLAVDPDVGKLAADHTRARAAGGEKADRLLHGLCNKRRGDGTRDHLRPAITGEDPTETAGSSPELGFRAMPWPI